MKHDRASLVRKMVDHGEAVEGPITLVGFCRGAGLDLSVVYRHFPGGFGELLAAAGMVERRGRVPRVKSGELMEEMERVARRLGRVPGWKELSSEGKYGVDTYYRRFGKWDEVVKALEAWRVRKRVEDARVADRMMGSSALRAGESGEGLPGARSQSLAVPGNDRAHCVRKPETSEGSGMERRAPNSAVAVGPEHRPAEDPLTGGTGKTREHRSPEEPVIGVRGLPLGFRGLMYAPINELGVVHLFGVLAPEVEMAVEHIGSAFPDCSALRRGPDGKWRPVAVEFELRSSNFRVHGHNAERCDVIVCWEDDWDDCPLEVVELKDVLRKALAKGAV